MDMVLRILSILLLVSTFAFGQNSVKTNQYYGLDSCKLEITNTTGTGRLGYVGNNLTSIAPNGTYLNISALSTPEAKIVEYVPFGTALSVAQQNNTTNYFLIIAPVSKTVTGIAVWIDAAGSGNGIDIALYDYAGTTLLASTATPQSSISAGRTLIPFDATANVVIGTAYWVGIGNANGGTATFLMGQTGYNNTSYARVASATAICGATLPAGTSTNARIYFELY